MRLPYDMVLVDLDGTLLTDDKKINDNDIQVLHHLRDCGVKVVVATGRRYYSAKRLSRPIGEDLIILANNGNVVREVKTDRVLDKRAVAMEALILAYEIGAGFQYWPIFHINRYDEGQDIAMVAGFGEEAQLRYTKLFANRVKLLYSLDELKDEEVLAMVYVGDYHILERIEKRIKQRYASLNTHVVGQLIHFDGMLEIMHEEGSKWSAAFRLAKSFGIQPSRIVAIGDDLNDFYMISNAGRGIAMKNAHPRIIAAADEITEKSNNEGGLGIALKKLFAELW